MGNVSGIGVSAFGVGANINFKAANPSDAAKIQAFIQEVGIEKAQHIVDSSPEIAKILSDAGLEFPDDKVDVPGFVNDITPLQGAAIVQEFVKASEE